MIRNDAWFEGSIARHAESMERKREGRVKERVTTNKEILTVSLMELIRILTVGEPMGMEKDGFDPGSKFRKSASKLMAAVTSYVMELGKNDDEYGDIPNGSIDIRAVENMLQINIFSSLLTVSSHPFMSDMTRERFYDYLKSLDSWSNSRSIEENIADRKFHVEHGYYVMILTGRLNRIENAICLMS